MNMDKYPTHQRLANVKAESQLIGAFLDWLAEDARLEVCELVNGRDEYWPARISTAGILARYFDIDLVALGKEEEAMLAEWRAAMDGGEAGE